MAATGSGDLWGGVFEGSISGSHMEVSRRPYHRNCNCALHESRGTRGNKMCHHHKPPKISFPIRRCWSEGSLALYANAVNASSSVNSPSPSSSPAIDAISHQHQHNKHHRHLEICNEDQEGDDLFPTKL